MTYTAIVLDDKSRGALLEVFSSNIPDGWEVIAHHMTMKMGSLNGTFALLLGQTAELTVTHFAIDDKVCAVMVDSHAPSTNKVKHITLAVNRDAGGKPVMSNQLTSWEKVSPLKLTGIVKEE